MPLNITEADFAADMAKMAADETPPFSKMVGSYGTHATTS